MKKIAVLGMGSWGTAMSIILSENGHQVTLWGRNEKAVNEVNEIRENTKYLGGVKLPRTLNVSSDLQSAVKEAEIVILAVTSQANRGVMETIKKYIGSKVIIVNLSKGLELETNFRASEISNEILPDNPFVALSGPSHAEEVAKKMPTALVAASESSMSMEAVQKLFVDTCIRVYTNSDVIGVELGGAFKNIVALGVGVIDGFGLGDNSKAAVMTRGMTEIVRLASRLGADISTFYGLAGMGDLIVTCTSLHSRNRRAGILLGQGAGLDEVQQSIGMAIEGINATKIAYKLSNDLGVEMPIVNQMYKVIFERYSVESAVSNLMSRDKKEEIEELVKLQLM